MRLGTKNWEESATWYPRNLTQLSPKFNNGKKIDCINQKLGYLVRCGDPDAIDSIVPMAYGNSGAGSDSESGFTGDW